MSRLKAALESAKKKNKDRSDAKQSLPSAGPASAPPPSGDESNFAANVTMLRMQDVRRLPANTQALAANRILTHDTRSPAEGSYRMLRTRLMQKMRSHGWRVLGVSSLTPNEGKSFTSINLAISIAAEVGQEALLIDLDLRRPSVHEYLGIDAGQIRNSIDYFDGRERDIRELLVCPGIERLGCLLSAAALDRPPSDVLASPFGRQLFEDIRRRLPPETIVIVDLPPLLAVDDALAVAPMLDGLLLVVAEGYAKRQDLMDARELLQQFNVIGTVLNKSVERDTRKSYYY
jgi:protein-tyrosine kinase